jgi:3' terminal RNA ribose 2'-O-methyltransferase Hen1
MLLTITTTHEPATDLGYLLHKNPARPQSFALSFGQAHVFYPEASDARCTAALLLDVDPIGLVRGRGGRDNAASAASAAFGLEQYVNDRPYAASSFLSVAIAGVFGSALAGRSKDRPELVAASLPLRATLAVVPARGGPDLLCRLFAPLGYEVMVQSHALDDRFPDWGDSRYYTLGLAGNVRLRDLLTHLYVLVPVLDDDKHYWVGDDEVEKLLRHGGDWLPTHPERDLIARRYLKHRRDLARDALSRLTDADDRDPDGDDERGDCEEETVERPFSLHDLRLRTVMAEIRASGAASVLDVGCGEGKLLRMLLDERSIARIAGMDVSHRALERAREKLRLDRLPETWRERVALIHGSLMYRDARLAGYDAAAVVEVVEHLDPPRLAAFERVLFEAARPGTVVLTTPNREYNRLFPGLPPGALRHPDHRFEWTRAELHVWATGVADRHGYAVRFRPIGPEDPDAGAPSQMAVFTRV